MLVDLLLFSVEKNVFASSHDARPVTDDHVTTMRHPDIYRCAGLLPAAVHSMLKMGGMLAFGDVTCRKVTGFLLICGSS